MFSIVWTKGCRRCGGDLSLEDDRYGAYIACLQCGAVQVDLAEQATVDASYKSLEMLEERALTA